MLTFPFLTARDHPTLYILLKQIPRRQEQANSVIMQIRNILPATILLAAPGVFSAPAPIGNAVEARAPGPVCKSPPMVRREW